MYDVRNTERQSGSACYADRKGKGETREPFKGFFFCSVGGIPIQTSRVEKRD